MRYLQFKRLEYSLTLLRETDMSIKSIADEIGYAHAANFTIAFTKSFGNSVRYTIAMVGVNVIYQEPIALWIA